MNLADAIRKAANRTEVASEPIAMPKQTNEPKAQEEDVWSKVAANSPAPKAPKPVEIPSVAPDAPHPSVQAGNAIRLEIFLNGEQMSGMLKAIMAGQHSVLTLREAASYLRVSPSTLEKLVDDGELPAVEIDGRYRFPKSNLDDWLAVQSAAHEEEKDVA